LILAVWACSLPGSEEVVDVATSVAATLTAAASGPTAPGPAAMNTAGPPTATPPPPALRIVYLDAGDLMLMEGGAPPVTLTGSGDGESVRISDDGAKIVYTRRSSYSQAVEMRSVNVDGSGDMTLLSPAFLGGLYPLPTGTIDVDVSSFEFVPGTHTILFNTLAIPAEVGLYKFDDLLTVDADTGMFRSLLEPGAGGDFSLSPDGSQMTITRPGRISLVNRDGTNLRPDVVTHAGVATNTEAAYYAVPSWTPDSSAAGVVIPSSDPFAPDASGSIWIIPADGTPATQLADIPGDFFRGQGTASALSPDLDRLGFTRPTATPTLSDLILANADGTGEIVYGTGQIFWRGWSPDGIHFGYAYGPDMVLHIAASGDNPVPLTTGRQLRWINATQFLYLSGEYGTWILQLGEIGAASIPLATPAGELIAYDFDP
jgi:hypothetical protein